MHTARVFALAIAFLVSLLSPCALAHEVGYQSEEPAYEEEPAATEAQGDEGLEARIEAVIETKLAPIKAELSEIHSKVERPGIAEIVGGIGWIVGILGIIAYLKSRKGSR